MIYQYPVIGIIDAVVETLKKYGTGRDRQIGGIIFRTFNLEQKATDRALLEKVPFGAIVKVGYGGCYRGI